VAILAAIAGVGAVLGILAGAFLIHGIDSLDVVDAIIVIPALGLVALYLALARGAWTLQPWAWTLGLVAAVGTILYGIAILTTQWAELMRDAPALAWMAILVVIVAAIGLVGWLRQDVKAAFGEA
jgi:hypothetical protein